MTDEIIYLKCVKEGSKLRVKIISPGFFNDANSQFPKNIRVENRLYSVPRNAISFVEGPQRKFFYRINPRANIVILEEESREIPQKIFEDPEVTECIICMSKYKDTVFANCGHYVCCEECSLKIFTGDPLQGGKKCPVCRSKISYLVKKEFIFPNISKPFSYLN